MVSTRRIYHLPADKLKESLQRVGISSKVLDLVKPACDKCSICRKWARPGPASKLTTTLRTRINEEVQLDIFLIGQNLKFLHALDVALRFGLAWQVESKSLKELASVLHRQWIRYFGPPENISSDQEGALAHMEFGRWCERLKIKRHFLPKEDPVG